MDKRICDICGKYEQFDRPLNVYRFERTVQRFWGKTVTDKFDICEDCLAEIREKVKK